MGGRTTYFLITAILGLLVLGSCQQTESQQLVSGFIPEPTKVTLFYDTRADGPLLRVEWQSEKDPIIWDVTRKLLPVSEDFDLERGVGKRIPKEALVFHERLEGNYKRFEDKYMRELYELQGWMMEELGVGEEGFDDYGSLDPPRVFVSIEGTFTGQSESTLFQKLEFSLPRLGLLRGLVFNSLSPSKLKLTFKKVRESYEARFEWPSTASLPSPKGIELSCHKEEGRWEIQNVAPIVRLPPGETAYTLKGIALDTTEECFLVYIGGPQQGEGSLELEWHVLLGYFLITPSGLEEEETQEGYL